MSKYSIKEVWDYKYGNKENAYDYAGRLMCKSACGNPYSSYHPTIDPIRPVSKGGLDVLENLVICHRDTNLEKASNFPHWKANGERYKAIRAKGTRSSYEIVDDE